MRWLCAIASVAVCGDYSCSFSDGYYFTNKGRTAVEKAFLEMGGSILTRNQKECIDHIAISERFCGKEKVSVEEWNQEKVLSDHKGIVVDF